jgi:hypothetical protein
MKKIIIYIVLGCATQISIANEKNFYPATIPLNEKQYSIEVKARYFATDGYYDLNGEEQELTADHSFSLMDGDLLFQYGLTPNFSAEGLLRFRNVSSETTESQSTQGLESVGLGFYFHFLEKEKLTGPIKKSRLALHTYYRHTAYSNTHYQNQIPPRDELVLGDDGGFLGVGALFSYSFNPSWRLDFSSYFVKPPSHLSEEYHFATALNYSLSSLSIFVGAESIVSAGNDDYADTPGLKPVLADGATSQFNSINRTLVMGRIGAHFLFSPQTRLELSMAQTFQGESFDRGQEYQLGLKYFFGGISKAKKEVESYKEYDIEARVTKVTPKGNYVRIDQGLKSGISNGMVFDLYKSDFLGKNELIAKAIVVECKTDYALLKIAKRLRADAIEENFVARARER